MPLPGVRRIPRRGHSAKVIPFIATHSFHLCSSASRFTLRIIKRSPFSFNTSLKIEFQDSRVISGSGVVPGRELDKRLGFGGLIERQLTDSRPGKNTQLLFADLSRLSVYCCSARYEDVEDAERLGYDLACQLIGS